MKLQHASFRVYSGHQTNRTLVLLFLELSHKTRHDPGPIGKDAGCVPTIQPLSSLEKPGEAWIPFHESFIS